MARVRSPARDEAFEIYKKHNRNISNREIANIVNEDEKKIAVWKQRDKWNDKINSVIQQKKKCCTTKENNKKSSKKSKDKEPIAEEVKEVLENTELTEKQRLFCIYYIKYFNATKAYQKAYQVDYDTANAHGYKLLSNVVIKDELQKLKQAKLNRVMLSEDDIFQKYIDIGFADITDFLEFGNEEVDGEFGRYTRSYVNIKHSFEVDGTLISEVSQGKDGVKVKLQDKMRALQWLSDRMDLLPTATRIKLDNEQKKLDNILNKGDKDNSEKDDVLAKMLEGLRNGL